MIDLLVEKSLPNEKEALLEARFISLCQNFGLTNELATKYWTQLYDLYNDPNRHYHNLVHIFNLLNLLDKYKLKIQRPTFFELAIWYHDAIYNVKEKDNEWQSAKLVQSLFEKYLNKVDLDYINALIMSTEGHTPRAETEDTYLFLDFDLSILAAEKIVYDQYSAAIWQEYKIAYLKILYKIGRKKVLKNFLARPKVYFSDLFSKEAEETARKNMALELNMK